LVCFSLIQLGIFAITISAADQLGFPNYLLGEEVWEMFVEVLLEAILDGLTAVGAVELLSRGLGSYLLPLLGRKTRDVGRGGGRDRSRTGGGAAAEG
jgi:hypothetical protein